jgi:hypothetical protein
MIVLAAGCLVLGFLYYRTIKNLNTTRNNLTSARQHEQSLQSQLNEVQVSGPASQDGKVGVTVKIPELGLQYQDTGQFGDLIWILDYIQDKPSKLQLSSRGVLAAENKYLASPVGQKQSMNQDGACLEGNIGFVSKVEQSAVSNFLPANTHIDDLLKSGHAVKIDNFYLIWTPPQNMCFKDQSTANLEAEVVNSQIVPNFLKALQPLK